MSTRSRIGLELSDGSVISSYCHFDGYPEYNDRILRTHYNTREKVEELIDLGDCSSIWTDNVWGQQRTDGKKYGPEPYSARGKDCPPRLDKNIGEYLCEGEEYAYLFRNGEWVCYDLHDNHHNKPKLIEIPSAPLHV
jgi:hypothetical protein